MLKTFAAALFLLSAPGAAFAQQAESIALEPGEAVTLRVDLPGKAGASIVGRGRAEWTEYDLAVARNFVSGAFDDAIGDNSVPLERGVGIPEPPAVAPGEVRLRFLDVAGRHTELILENGHDRALVYRAEITSGGRTGPTDVCIVPPNNRSVEHWPYLIDRIVLSAIRLVDWTEGQRVTCE